MPRYGSLVPRAVSDPVRCRGAGDAVDTDYFSSLHIHIHVPRHDRDFELAVGKGAEPILSRTTGTSHPIAKATVTTNKRTAPTGSQSAAFLTTNFNAHSIDCEADRDGHAELIAWRLRAPSQSNALRR